MRNHLTIAAVVAALLSSAAMAATIENVTKLSDKTPVNVDGVVDSVKNEREFILRDKAGNAVDVDVTSNQSLTLKEGDEVNVSGKVNKGMISSDIDATNVTVDKGIAEGVSDAVKSIPGVSTIDAKAFKISDLPNKGTVKVSGTVTDVDSEKEFTLKDSTGSINIDITSAESAVLTKGAEVTVIGSVDKGILGKDINATQVLVIADSRATKE